VNKRIRSRKRVIGGFFIAKIDSTDGPESLLDPQDAALTAR
jgi:hypothetical protein